MSQSNQSPPGQPAAAPRVHHVHPGTPASQPGTDTGIDPAILKDPRVLRYLGGSLPAWIVMDGGMPRAVPQVTPPPDNPQKTPEQVVQMLKDLAEEAFLRDPSKVPLFLAFAMDLSFLTFEINQEFVRINLPYNNTQVRAGGYAMLEGASLPGKDPPTMEVDTDALAQELARCEVIRGLRAVIDPRQATLEANDTHALNAVATRVDDGLVRGDSVIQANGQLKRVLGPALAIKGDPAQQRLTTQAANARRDDKVRNDTQQADQGAAEPAAPPQTTVMLQQGNPAPPTPAAKQPTEGGATRRPGHPRKPGQ